jgi:hypothetical protein
MAVATSPTVNPVADPVLTAQKQDLNPATIPDQHSVDAFQKAMQVSSAELASRSPLSGPESVKPATAAIGDAILNGLEQMRHGWPDGLKRIETDLSSASNDLADQSRALFKAQVDVALLGLQQDLTSKVANQVSQGIQTIFRNQ